MQLSFKTNHAVAVLIAILAHLIHAHADEDCDTYSGKATYYLQQGVAGACGIYHPDTDFIVALPPSTYQDGDNCGREITVTNLDNDKSRTAIVADLCPGCMDIGDLDLSYALYGALNDDDYADGFEISWDYN